ncbi:MAG TPA: DUF47 family protein [Nitrososphaerales archaeon]|nr:DUF47 family protein [Nitrososphaerales archaeon]
MKISFGGRERAIFQGVEGDLRIVASAVESFSNMIAALAAERQEDAAGYLQEVLDKEKEADDSHRALSTQIAEGAFFGGVREDMLNLLEKIDNIADSAKDAARLIETEGSLDSTAVSLLKTQAMKDFILHQRDAVSALQDLVAALEVSKSQALSKVHIVEELEEAADTDKSEVIRQLFSNTTGVNPITVIQMRDFMFEADDIADNAEDASDVVLILIAKGYG